MKKLMIYGGLFLLSCLLLVVAPQRATAQTPAVLDGTPGGQTGGDGNGDFGDGPVVPLDGGLSSILLASAIGFGMRKTGKSIQKEVL